jgi:hypothetical protein
MVAVILILWSVPSGSIDQLISVHLNIYFFSKQGVHLPTPIRKLYIIYYHSDFVCMKVQA